MKNGKPTIDDCVPMVSKPSMFGQEFSAKMVLVDPERLDAILDAIRNSFRDEYRDDKDMYALIDAFLIIDCHHIIDYNLDWPFTRETAIRTPYEKLLEAIRDVGSCVVERS